ncbi:MAG: Arm DNA-binding domain-containing protein, partial [Gammaproteobacteria bacterium]
MARHLIKTDATIRTTKSAEATLRLSDGDGLYLLVKPNGARWWRLDYSIGGKRKTLSIGVYP